MAKRTLKDVDLSGSRVLVRVDFNVPIEQGVEFLSSYDQRLRVTLPTIQYLLERDCRIVLCSHLGRPQGKVVEGLRMAPVAERLSMLMSRAVTPVGDCTGPEVRQVVDGMSAGDIVMLENLRFHPEEEKNDPGFAGELASLADVFVMDAFAVAHRAHASVVGVPRFLPSVAGLLVESEVEHLGRAVQSPERPMAALMGGAKVSDKILLIENLLDKLDRLFVGGGMAVTFLRALGHSTGASRVEEERLEFASNILRCAEEGGITVHVPRDVVVSREFSAGSGQVRVVPADQVPPDWYVMDIGDLSVQDYIGGLRECKTVIWNGPMGVFEFEPFSKGTRRIGDALASLNATTIVGGGSTAEAVEEMGLMGRMTHVSTGGGASLEFLEGKELPGIAALPDRE